MKEKGEQISFVNKFLKSRVLPLNAWERKQPMKSNHCDICSRIFVNQHGVNVHKKKMHGDGQIKGNKQVRKVQILKTSSSLSRSISVSSASDLSPPPKKLNKDINKREKRVLKTKHIEVAKMEESGLDSHRESDTKVDFSSQCNIESTNISNQKSTEINELKEDLRLVREQVALMKADAQELKAHNTRKFTGYKSDYNELMLEKNNIL